MESFLSNLLGAGTYNRLKGYSKFIFIIGTSVLCVLFLLSFFFHWTFISRLLSLTTGTSLLFLVYIVAVIIALDKQVETEEPGRTHSTKYKLTIIWGVTLVILGLFSVFLSNRYRKQYAFDCSVVWVDHKAGVYHLECVEDCEFAANSDNIEKMRGYEIKGMNYKLCEWCKEYAVEMEDAYNEDLYTNQ